MLFIKKLKAVLLTLTVACTSAQATLIFSEDFTGGSASLLNSVNVKWSDSSGGGFEVYSAGGAGARGMKGTYDHDGDSSTAQIALPAGIEVNDDQGNELLTAQFTLNTMIQANELAQLSFWGGVRRNNAIGASVEIYNVSQDISISGLLTPTLGSGDWIFNQFSFASNSAAVGDLLEIRWQGGGTNSANGQEIAMVDFSTVTNPQATVVPEPTSIAIFGLGLLGLLANTRRKKQ